MRLYSTLPWTTEASPCTRPYISAPPAGCGLVGTLEAVAQPKAAAEKNISLILQIESLPRTHWTLAYSVWCVAVGLPMVTVPECEAGPE